MADKVDLSDDTLDRLAKRLQSSGGGSGGSSGGAGKATGEFAESLDKIRSGGFNPLNTALEGTSAAAGAAQKAYSSLEGVIKPGMQTWQKLSDTGASFSNDIVGMSAAASGARLNLGEFADLMKKNAGNFNALGGSATKGAENFAKLSKEMQDNGASDGLRKLGMTTSDINDVLALQASLQQGVNMDNEQSRKKAIASAVALATEMDGMAKLTGISRKEQEEIMQKARTDMQVESKLRLLTMGKSEDEAKAIRDNYYKQQKEAELRGQGQMFKEVFATGTIQSKEAQMQVAISGKEAQATISAAVASQKGDIEAANKFAEEARIQNSLNQRDANKLQLGTLGATYEAGKSQMDSMSKNQKYYEAEQGTLLRLEREGKLKGMTEEQKLRAVHADQQHQIELEQLNKTEDEKGKVTDKAGSKSTEALVAVATAAGSAESALMNSLAKPLNEKVGPVLNHIAQQIVPSQVVRNKEGGGTEKLGLGAAMEKDVAAGRDKSQTAGNTADVYKAVKSAPDTGYALGNSAQALGGLGGGGTQLIVDGLNKIDTTLQGLSKHAEGTTTSGPELAIIGEAGKEYVVPDDKMQNLMQNIKLDGLATATEALTKDKGDSGIDINAMSKMVTTSISSASNPGTSPAAPSGQNTKSSVTEDDTKQYTEIWKKNYAEQNVIKIGEEKRQAKEDIAFDQQTIANKSQIIQDLKTIQATRELTDEEQKELTKAEKRKARAEQHLASDQARLDVLNDIDKNGLANQAKMAEDFQTAQSRLADIQAASSEEEQAAKEQAINDLNKLSIAAYGDSSNEQTDKIKEIKNISAGELLAHEMANNQKITGKVKDAKDMSTAELIARDMANVQNMTGKVKDVKDMSTDELIKRDMQNIQNSTLIKTKELSDEEKLSAKKAEYTKMSTALDADPKKLESLKKEIELGDKKAEYTKMSTALDADPKKLADLKKQISSAENEAAPKNVKSADMWSEIFANIKTPDAKAISATATKLKPEEDVKKEEEAKKKAELKKAQEHDVKETMKKPVPATGEVTLKEVHKSLEHLNSTMTQLLSAARETVSVAQAQVKAVKAASGNRLA